MAELSDRELLLLARRDIESLSAVVMREFETVRREFRDNQLQNDKRLSNAEQRDAEHERQIIVLQRDMSEMGRKFDSYTAREEALEAELTKRISQLESRITQLESRAAQAMGAISALLIVWPLVSEWITRALFP